MQDFNQASAFLQALGDVVFDFRAIHDQDKGVPAIPLRGTLDECWNTLINYNNHGYGIFVTINELDGLGREYQNVKSIRAHFVDLDNINAMINYERACQFNPLPSFAVNSSPNKMHVYWPVQRYLNTDYFTLMQRKLVQFFEGDPRVIDAPRVMRLPGTLHLKNEPYLVTCHSLGGYGQVYDVSLLDQALSHINITKTVHNRKSLGDPELAAPSLAWLEFALTNTDPNDLDRTEWIAFTSAIKQSGWSLTDNDTLFKIWSNWCSRYLENDEAENLKQWNSIRDTQLGWKSIEYKVPAVHAHMTLGKKQLPDTTSETKLLQTPPAMPEPPELDCKGELLTDYEQKVWFKGCAFIENFGLILTPSGRMMNATKFNGAFGGKKFIIDETAKITNEPWQAATRSTLWTIPKVDHVRFLPHREHLEIFTDELERKGINMYKPANIKSQAGDPTPFLNHLNLIIPNKDDQKILLDYFAHNIKYPGYKIPWSPLIQSAEGVGKGIFKSVMKHCMAAPYVYYPSAKEMVTSGAKFNAWMRNRLFIIVDEIHTDERRDMIEVLKPMISEKEIEIQGKGVDQDKEDNYSNWLFFSNWKDAIPVDKNARRFSINYSQLQTAKQIEDIGMDYQYFSNLLKWLENGGLEIIAHYFFNYPIEKGAIPMRAPTTSSTAEALRQSRSPLEQLILNSVEDQLQGFRGGFISVQAVMNRIEASKIRSMSPKTVQITLEKLGYTYIGRSTRAYFAEDSSTRSDVYGLNFNMSVETYGMVQGYE